MISSRRRALRSGSGHHVLPLVTSSTPAQLRRAGIRASLSSQAGTVGGLVLTLLLLTLLFLLSVSTLLALWKIVVINARLHTF